MLFGCIIFKNVPNAVKYSLKRWKKLKFYAEVSFVVNWRDKIIIQFSILRNFEFSFLKFAWKAMVKSVIVNRNQYSEHKNLPPAPLQRIQKQGVGGAQETSNPPNWQTHN